MLINFNLHYIKKLLCKCELSWTSGSLEDKINDPLYILHCYNYFPFICKNLNSLLYEDDLYPV
jgi:hypothetical protein